MPDQPAADTVAALLDWWLEVRCTCGRSTFFPMTLLARRFGPGARVPALVARMRCRARGAAPVVAELVDDPQAGAPGYVGGRPPTRRPVG